MMKHKTYLLVFLLVTGTTLYGQNNANTVSKKEVKGLVNQTNNLLDEYYVDLNLAQEMSTILNANLKAGHYFNINDRAVLARKMSKDLQAHSLDQHLKLDFDPKRVAKMKRKFTSDDSLKQVHRQKKGMQRSNFGFSSVEILDGNIGYLDIKYFAEHTHAETAMRSAMSFLSNTNAIIIDLRDNGGGVPSSVQALSGCFFEDQILLNTFYNRSTKVLDEFRTIQIDSSLRFSQVPLFILTSRKTFSAAEAFAYNLKHLGRATIVGEPTRGGANRTKRFILNDEFTISVPYIKAIHPVTNTNWERKGVQPDMKVEADRAFARAYVSAVDQVLGDHPMKNRLINKIGYNFLNDHKIMAAIQFFDENTKFFPEDANAWDSLGEAYFEAKEYGKSLVAYEKSLLLDPNSVSAKSMIKKIQSK